MAEDGEDAEDRGDGKDLGDVKDEEGVAKRGQEVTVRLVARSGSSSISMTIE